MLRFRIQRPWSAGWLVFDHWSCCASLMIGSARSDGSSISGLMQPVATDAENDHTKSKYASLAAIDHAVRGIYTSTDFP